MQKIIHRAEERGKTETDWLNSYHTFSFSSFYDPQRLRFGKLRVLNDDTVKPGRGFDMHPHGDMEIISIPLKGGLKHGDSKGNREVIREGCIQVMTAGNGIMHSEYNASDKEDVNFLQIWIIPKRKSLEPNYTIKQFNFDSVKNDFLLLITPHNNHSDDNTLQINQHAWVCYGKFDKDESTTYPLKDKNNGVYVFITEGKINVAGDILKRRDGLGIHGEKEIPLVFEEDSEFFVFEIPME